MSRFHTHYEAVKLEVACVKKAPASLVLIPVANVGWLKRSYMHVTASQ